jgi:tRNA (guanosine-2'-O-)-methyltransferase
MPHPTSISDERAAKLETALRQRQPTLTVAFENVHDPHNVSAVIRTCDAVGVLEAHGIYYGRDTFPSLGEKSSASARKWVDVRLHNSVSECFQVLRQKGFAIYTTHLDAQAESVYDLDLTKPTALVFGNEHDGVSQEARDLADGNVLVPMMGVVQSLNISVACAVSLFEALRQRTAAGMYSQPQLDSAMLESLKQDWFTR